MKWKEFKEQTLNDIALFDSYNWKRTDIECPVCRGTIYKNIGIVLTSYPPQYQYKCPRCGWFDTWY